MNVVIRQLFGRQVLRAMLIAAVLFAFGAVQALDVAVRLPDGIKRSQGKSMRLVALDAELEIIAEYPLDKVRRKEPAALFKIDAVPKGTRFLTAWLSTRPGLLASGHWPRAWRRDELELFAVDLCRKDCGGLAGEDDGWWDAFRADPGIEDFDGASQVLDALDVDLLAAREILVEQGRDPLRASHPALVIAAVGGGDGVKVVGLEGVTEPELISKAAPNSPSQLRSAGLGGVVVLSAVVGADGSVSEPRVLYASRERLGLEEEAMRAVRGWRYAPARQDGKPVPVIYSILIEFAPMQAPLGTIGQPADPMWPN